MSSYDARPVKLTVTKLTNPEKLAELLLTFLTNKQVYRCGRGFEYK